MEFAFEISDVPREEVLKIDHTLSIAGHDTDDCLKNKIQIIIDEMGKASAVAQELKSPKISSSDLNSDHVVYMMTEPDAQGNFSVVGVLKMGWKKMDLFNKAGLRSEAIVHYLLDFYIPQSKQRQGYGKRLLNFMLQDTGLEARHLAIDKPTKKLLHFLRKQYQLSKFVNQGNNFIVYEEFFDDTFDEKNHGSSGNSVSSQFKEVNPLSERKDKFCTNEHGRHSAHKHHDSMDEIVKGQGDADFVKLQCFQDNDYAENKFKEVNPPAERKDKFCTNEHGRHSAHKHHDSMGEIVEEEGDADFVKLQCFQDNDYAENKFKEVNPPSERKDKFCTNEHGRHSAHKHHDSMGEIVEGEGDAAFVKHKCFQDNDYVENEFKEVNPPSERKDKFCTNEHGRHSAHKHHDSMGEIVEGEGDADYVKLKCFQDNDYVENEFKEVNPPSERKDKFCTNEHGRHSAHKHHDSMGEIVKGQGDADFVKLQCFQDNDYVENKFKKVNPPSERKDKFCTNEHGRHSAHKHHDSMGEIVKSEGDAAFVNQFKEVDLHSESKGAVRTDEHGNSVT